MTEASMMEAIREHAKLFDVASQAVIATTVEGEIVYWSNAAVELYGWKRSYALGRSIVEITPAEATRDQAAEIMETLRTGRSWSGKFRVRREDGTEFEAQVTDVPVRNPAGELIGIIGVSTLA